MWRPWAYLWLALEALLPGSSNVARPRRAYAVDAILASGERISVSVETNQASADVAASQALETARLVSIDEFRNRLRADWH